MPLPDLLVVAGITALCAAASLLLGALLLRAVERRSVLLHLLVGGAASLVTVTAALAATTWRMVLTEHDSVVVLVVVGLSVPAAVGVAALLGGRLRRSADALAAAAERVGDRTYDRPDPAPTSRELAAIGEALDRAHSRVTEAQAREAAVEHSRRELVAGMSHDLRTPLAGMRAMVESLEDGLAGDDATVARYHRQLRIELDRVSRMVADLFELSRVQGSLRLDLERVGAADLVDEALASTDPVARAKGVRLVAATGGADLPVVVDPTELGRVLRNLLLNAIRHTPSDGTIHVSAESLPDGVSFSVTDACGGIPAEDLPRVFDVSFRGAGARTASDHDGEPGGGLGLAIARGIVEAHQGMIDVMNQDGGCRFVVRLPLAAD